MVLFATTKFKSANIFFSHSLSVHAVVIYVDAVLYYQLILKVYQNLQCPFQVQIASKDCQWFQLYMVFLLQSTLCLYTLQFHCRLESHSNEMEELVSDLDVSDMVKVFSGRLIPSVMVG